MTRSMKLRFSNRTFKIDGACITRNSSYTSVEAVDGPTVYVPIKIDGACIITRYSSYTSVEAVDGPTAYVPKSYSPRVYHDEKLGADVFDGEVKCLCPVEPRKHCPVHSDTPRGPVFGGGYNTPCFDQLEAVSVDLPESEGDAPLVRIVPKRCDTCAHWRIAGPDHPGVGICIVVDRAAPTFTTERFVCLLWNGKP
jgi:hypothetical protein